MTVSVQNNRISYNGNGSTQNFAYNYLFQNGSDLIVILQDADGVDTTQVLNTDYTVTGAGTGTGNVAMITAPASGEKLIIYSAPAISQEVDLQSGSDLPEDSLEDALDKSILVSRYLNDQVGRSIKLKNSDTSSPTLEIPLLTDRASKVLGFDDDGNLIVTELDASSTSVTSTGSSTSRTLANRFADVANIKDFGGVGDGVTNCDTALADAQASGADVVFFPSGDYLVTTLPTITDGVTFTGPGRIVTSITHRRTWEYGGWASTSKAMNWYVDPAGNDANDGLSWATPFKTIQRAIDQLPNIIRHQQTINLSAGTHNTSDLAANDPRQWERPAVVQINGKWVTGRTNTLVSGMIGGIVIKGQGNTVTTIESASGYTQAIMYVTGHSLFIGLINLGFKQNGATVPQGAIFAHKGARVHMLNTYHDSNSTGMAGMIAEQGIIEATNTTFINGTINTYAALAVNGTIELNRTSAGSYDDGTFGIYHALYNSFLYFSGQGTVNSPVSGRDSTFVFQGVSNAAKAIFTSSINITNSTVSLIYAQINDTATQTYNGGCQLYFNNVSWQNGLYLYNSFITFDSSSSYISPSTSNTQPYAVYLRNGSNMNLLNTNWLYGNGASSNDYRSANRGYRTLAYSSNNQTLAVNSYDTVLDVSGSAGSYTGCQLNTSAFSQGSEVVLQGNSSNSVTFAASGTYMNLPLTLAIGTGVGQYNSAVLVLINGKWNLKSLGYKY